MMHLFINALAASAGGGLTYIRNVIPEMASRPDLRVTVLLGTRLRQEFPVLPSVEFITLELPTLRRFWYEQATLPAVIGRSGANVLLSVGNFAVRESPVPQILLSRNSLYTSSDFYRDLRNRGEYALLLDTRLRGWMAKKSVHWADVTVAPSEAFAAELQRWTGRSVRAIHHGFDHELFAGDGSPLAEEIEDRLRPAQASFKLLFVSHYNYYRNFETLLRALPLLRQRVHQDIKLLLTCDLASKKADAYRPQNAARLLRELGVEDMVVGLGTVPYAQLHHLYRRADAYVTPAYAETFAHPLVEAMSSGLPVIASDIPVHREICGGAAVYFSRFAPEELADRVMELMQSQRIADHLRAQGRERAKRFSWKAHVDGIVEIAQNLTAARTGSADRSRTRDP